MAVLQLRSALHRAPALEIPRPVQVAARVFTVLVVVWLAALAVAIARALVP